MKMIDTIKLALHNKRITNCYDTTLKGLADVIDDNKKRVKSITRVQKQSKIHKDLGLYYIRVDETNPLGRDIRVNLEFSIPKFLYGSNLYEVNLDSANYKYLIQKLHEYLKDKIENLTYEDIEHASIHRIDFCKNIIFDTLSSDVNWFISYVSTYDFDKRYNLLQKNYINQKRTGVSCSFYNKQQSLKFYNKLEEILNQKDPKITEQIIARNLLGDTTKQVLRVERSLQNRSAVLSTLGHYIYVKKHFHIKDIWNMELSKSILMDYLKVLSQNNLNLLNSYISPDKTIEIKNLLAKHDLKTTSIIILLKFLIDELGVDGMKHFLSINSNSDVSKYLKKHLRSIESLSCNNTMNIANMWSDIYRQLNNSQLITPNNLSYLVYSRV